MTQKGRYEDAMTRMDEVDAASLRILKNYQYWTMFSGLLKLKRLLHRYRSLCSQPWSFILTSFRCQGQPPSGGTPSQPAPGAGAERARHRL